MDDLPLVSLCRERRDLIRAASDQRYALAAAHLAYFQALRDIGDALRKFSDEELVLLAAESSSIPDSPVLTLPSDEGKPRRRPKPELGKKSPSSSVSISHSHSHLDSSEEEGIEDSHLHLSSDSEQDSGSGHIRIEDSPKREDYYPNRYPPATPSYYNPGDWGSPNPPEVNSSSYMYYAKRSETQMQSMVYEEPETEKHSFYGGYSGYSQYNDGGSGGGGGFFGFSMGSPQQNERRGLPDPPQAPPSPPKVSSWDFLNFFDTYDNDGYGHIYPGMRYAYGSNTSSPDSNEVREREGIPDLEDETDPEALKVRARKKVNDYQDAVKKNVNSGEGTSRSVPKQQQSSEGSSRSVPLKRTESPDSVQETEVKSSSGTIDTIDTSVTKSPAEESSRKKGVSFEIDEPNLEVESSKRSSMATLTVHRTRDLQEVVKEIRDEFETASSFGKEVAVLLEVGNLPYQPRANALKGTFSLFQALVRSAIAFTVSIGFVCAA